MAKKIYVHTVKDSAAPSTGRKSGDIRLRALPGQKDTSGSAVDTSCNIASDHAIRLDWPVGTIFCVDGLEKVGGTAARKLSYKAIPQELVPIANHEMISLHDSSDASVAKQAKKLRDDYLEYLEKNFVAEYVSNLTDGGVSSPLVPVPGVVGGIPVNPKVGQRVKVTNKCPRVFLTTYGKILQRDQFAVPTIEEDGFYVPDETWHVLCRNFIKGKNTLLLGPTGTGKTELVQLLYNRIGKALHIHDMSSMVDPQSGLLGVHRLIDGHSVFDYASFALNVQEPCGILLDELSRAPLGSNNLLFPCLDRRRSLPVEIADSKHARQIPVHKEVGFWATANVGSEYSGTQAIDRALFDRFFPIELGYMDVDNEAKVIIKRTKCDKKNAETIAKVARDIRTMYYENELSNCISHRHTMEIGSFIYDGFELGMAMKAVMYPLFEGTASSGERGSIAALINKF